ncbi:type II toxin-antitoxin system Phd/YefM family antitoxin [Neorhizobium alkalisoli]|uniref:Prevent-host-death family protein n=1 Tax=Neorhizobium alkalisoli TaxID=528178 RepID=A0A561R7A4_9HYPH|nr:type II toxin-antitoxin system prevent-host-death family antitoxin [Neorhizobium alkalisoli]TWF58478.1 prevent-host-death family protein [Neorhizobium alkalisoli]
MSQISYTISEARKNFTEILERANRGEEIIVMRGNDAYARIGPCDLDSKRPFGLLRGRGLPNDLFDEGDTEQSTTNSGE